VGRRFGRALTSGTVILPMHRVKSVIHATQRCARSAGFVEQAKGAEVNSKGFGHVQAASGDSTRGGKPLSRRGMELIWTVEMDYSNGWARQLHWGSAAVCLSAAGTNGRRSLQDCLALVRRDMELTRRCADMNPLKHYLDPCMPLAPRYGRKRCPIANRKAKAFY